MNVSFSYTIRPTPSEENANKQHFCVEITITPINGGVDGFLKAISESSDWPRLAAEGLIKKYPDQNNVYTIEYPGDSIPKISDFVFFIQRKV